MSKSKDIQSYVNDYSRNAVCGEMIRQYATGNNETKSKLCFLSRDQARSYSKSANVDKEQVPYLCQFCQTWHLGSSWKIGTQERDFIVTGYGELQMRPEVVEDTPLFNSVRELELQKYKLSTNELISFQKALDENRLFNISPTSVRLFKATPQMRAIVWAIHRAAPNQVVMIIKPDGRLAFRRNAGDLWSKGLIHE